MDYDSEIYSYYSILRKTKINNKNILLYGKTLDKIELLFAAYYGKYGKEHELYKKSINLWEMFWEAKNASI